MENERTIVVHTQQELLALPTRRNFLKALGMGGTLVLMPSLFAACTDDNTITSPTTTAPQTISLGTDAGIFTFAYVLEQLESSFYTQVVGLFGANPTLFNAAEQTLLADIRNDEITHREFLRAALGNSFPTLTFNFANVPVTNAGILSTALTFETNGIAAYNGAGYALKNANNLLVAGKIVSIEARHTSAIADAIDLRSASPTGTLYADLTQALPTSLGADPTNALDCAAPAAKVAGNAQPFIVNTITLA